MNGRLTNVELADRVGLTPAPCLRRVRRLEESAVITGYLAVIDPQAIGRAFEVQPPRDSSLDRLLHGVVEHDAARPPAVLGDPHRRLRLAEELLGGPGAGAERGVDEIHVEGQERGSVPDPGPSVVGELERGHLGQLHAMSRQPTMTGRPAGE